MSRVVANPKYSNSTEIRIRAITLSQDEDDIARSLPTLAQYLSHDTIDLITGFDPDLLSDTSTAVPQLSRKMILSLAAKDQLKHAKALSSLYPALMSNTRILFDDAAKFELYTKIILSPPKPSPRERMRFTKAVEQARTPAMLGLVASHLSPALSRDRVKMYDPIDPVPSVLPNAENLLIFSRLLRTGWRAKRSYQAAANLQSDEITVEQAKDMCSSKNSSFSKAFSDFEVYSSGSIAFIHHFDTCYVMDMNTINDLCDSLRILYQWCVYAKSMSSVSNSNDYLNLCTVGIKFLQENLSSASHEGRIKLARHIKVAYSIILARSHTKDAMASEVDLVKSQVEVLKRDLAEIGSYLGNWDELCLPFPDDIQLDMGQLWTVLPCADIDIIMLDKGLHEKFSKERKLSEDAWADFLNYSRGAISAHLLFDKLIDPNECAWTEGAYNPDVDTWVTENVNGKLTYPDETVTNFPIMGMKWTDHISNWFWSAADVTHVIADLKEYSSSVTTLSNTIYNELLYTMEYGSNLSIDYTTDEVIRRARSGHAPGDRINLVAGKAENTKYPGKQRDTHSADDIAREIYSEFDINVASIARSVTGVAMRAGNKVLEKNISQIIEMPLPNTIIFSADISGWSPNAPRSKEMAFADMLADFFDIEPTYRLSKVFKDQNFVFSKTGYHNSWTHNEGSVQGFFGGIDSIMHTMMIRWAFNRAKKAGIISPDTKIISLAMIDDMIARIDNISVSESEVVEFIVSYYSSLGYEVDVVKSLVSKKKGHFLNRPYVDGREIITASKIFAKVGREWERPIVTCWSVIDSIFGSAAGASDRGADPITTYCHAITIMLYELTFMGYEEEKQTLHSALCFVAMWMPRSLGGWNVPSYANWIGSSTSPAVEKSLSVATSIIRFLISANAEIAQATYSYYSMMISRELLKRSPTAVISDPLGLKASNIVDPSEPLLSAMSRCVRKVARSTIWSKFVNQVHSKGYEDAIKKLLDNTCAPASLLSSYASCLPHSVITKVTTKLETSSIILTQLRPSDMRNLRRNIERTNKAALTQWNTSCPLISLPELDRLSGCVDSAALRVKQMQADGFVMTGLRFADPADIITPDTNEVTLNIIVTPPKKDSSSRIIRTVCSSRPTLLPNGIDRTLDPIKDSATNMHSILSCLNTLGHDTTPFEDIYSILWFGKIINMTWNKMLPTGTNANRVSERLRRTQYSPKCYPNTLPSVKVKFANMLIPFQTKQLAADWLAIHSYLRVWSATSESIGVTPAMQGAGLSEYSFTLRAFAPFLVEDFKPVITSHWTPPRFPGILDESMRDSVIKSLQNMSMLYVQPDSNDTDIPPEMKRVVPVATDATELLSYRAAEVVFKLVGTTELAKMNFFAEATGSSSADVKPIAYNPNVDKLVNRVATSPEMLIFFKNLIYLSLNRDMSPERIRSMFSGNANLQGAKESNKVMLLNRLRSCTDETKQSVINTVSVYTDLDWRMRSLAYAELEKRYLDELSDSNLPNDRKTYVNMMRRLMFKWKGLTTSRLGEPFAAVIESASEALISIVDRRISETKLEPVHECLIAYYANNGRDPAKAMQSFPGAMSNATSLLFKICANNGYPFTSEHKKQINIGSQKFAHASMKFLNQDWFLKDNLQRIEMITPVINVEPVPEKKSSLIGDDDDFFVIKPIKLDDSLLQIDDLDNMMESNDTSVADVQSPDIDNIRESKNQSNVFNFN